MWNKYIINRNNEAVLYMYIYVINAQPKKCNLKNCCKVWEVVWTTTGCGEMTFLEHTRLLSAGKVTFTEMFFYFYWLYSHYFWKYSLLSLKKNQWRSPAIRFLNLCPRSNYQQFGWIISTSEATSVSLSCRAKLTGASSDVRKSLQLIGSVTQA